MAMSAVPRGWGKQLTALVTKLIAANVQAMLAFIDGEEEDQRRAQREADAALVAKRRARAGRPKTAGLEKYLPAPDEPFRQTGPHKIDIPKVEPPDPEHTKNPAA